MKFYGGKRKATYLRKKQSKNSSGRVAAITAAALLLAAGLSHAALRPEGQEQTAQSAVARTQPEAAPEQMRTESETRGEARVWNILLCGTDADGLRTDAILIGHLDEKTGRTALVSVPRDTPVETRDGTLMKLNAVYAGGGAEGMERLKTQIRKLLGVEADGWVLIGLDAFRRVVDALGGVEFDVPQDMDYEDPAQGLEIHLRAGRQRLDGEKAMQLVRYRSGYAMQDIERTGVQRAFLQTLGQSCLSEKSLTKLPTLARIFREEVTTDLSLAQLLRIARRLAGCELSRLESRTLSGEGVTVNGVSYYALHEDALRETARELLAAENDGLQVITPQRIARYQKATPARKTEQTEENTAETEQSTPEEIQIQPIRLPNDPRLWE